MSALDPDRAEALLRALVGLGKAQALYPPGHGAVDRSLAAVERVLGGAFPGGKPLVIGRTDSYLVVGDAPFVPEAAPAADMVRWLRHREIEGVEIRPGARPRELMEFLAWLVRGERGQWQGRDVRVTHISEDGAWERGLRSYGEAMEALEQAFREAQEGRIPDPTRACQTVQSFIGLLGENPLVVRGLSLIKSYDRYTFHHSVNVSLLALALGQHLGLDPEALEILGVGGLFHDIGKTRTPAQIIQKPGRLTSREWELVGRHPELGREILLDMPGVPPGADRIAYEHHMHPDGRGYPRRPPGYRVTRLSPLISVVDAYDAMTTHRSYSSPLPLPDAIDAVLRQSGTTFEPEAVEAFVAAMGRIPVGSAVRLATGEVAVVTRLDSEGRVVEARVAVDPAGRALPAAERPCREISPHDILRWVDPLVHGIRPHELLRPAA